MHTTVDFSPVSLSYVGALRGIKPRAPGTAFVYARANCRDAEALLCLAASNPEGKFYGLMPDPAAASAAEKLAAARGVENAVFVGEKLNEIVAAGKGALPPLDYLCCDERGTALTAVERAALYAAAEKFLLPGGLLCSAYKPYDSDDGALKFLVRELAPEMDVAQAKEFLQELKVLGQLYFATHRSTLAELDKAIAAGVPDAFFEFCREGSAASRSFDTLVAMRPRNFAYVGDANIGMNYMEMAAPLASHALIDECRTHPLYEVVKDLATNRGERADIWCRGPFVASQDLAELFGGFTYGIMVPRDRVPLKVETKAAPVDLAAPVYARLADLLTLMPAGIGDIMTYPETKSFTPAEIIGALHILIASAVVCPMRGRYETVGATSIAQPRLAGAFNQHLDQTSVTDGDVWMASTVAGRAVALHPRAALVMQALNRAGLADSVTALLPELQRLAQNPAASSRVMDVAEPTPEIAHRMIEDVVTQSIVQWYAYGLLKAA